MYFNFKLKQSVTKMKSMLLQHTIVWFHVNGVLTIVVKYCTIVSEIITYFFTFAHIYLLKGWNYTW